MSARADLEKLVSMTALVMETQFDLDDVQALVVARAPVVSRVAEARRNGCAWGAIENDLLESMQRMDNEMVSRLNAGFADARNWLAERDQARAKAA